jgi:hypothetical protein
VVTPNPRNNQKYLEGSQGLLERPSGKLRSFQPAAGFRKQGLMAKQTKITIETDSLLILRGRNSRRAWCPLCAAEGEMIALENAGVISNLDRHALEEWLNSGNLHRSQAADGSVLICLNSLLARVQNTKLS